MNDANEKVEGERSKLAMSPSELPQQRLAMVVDLPNRPAGLETKVDWIEPMQEPRPTGKPRSVEFLCAAEWAWSPWHERLDHYYLQKKKTHWILWNHSYDDNWGEWDWVIHSYAPLVKGDAFSVGTWMLADTWAAEAKEKLGFDHFHWLTSVGMLDVPTVRAIGRFVWGNTNEEAFKDDDE